MLKYFDANEFSDLFFLFKIRKMIEAYIFSYDFYVVKLLAFYTMRQFEHEKQRIGTKNTIFLPKNTIQI